MSHALTLLALSLLGTAPSNPADLPPGPWAMTLHDALRVGFDNCEFARLVDVGGEPDGKGLKIAPVDAKKSAGEFKAEAMNLALAIETRYWSIAQKNVDVTAAVAAADLAEQVLKRENAKLEVGLGNPDAIDAARTRLVQYVADRTVAVKDLFDAERQFRFVLGLPSEGRHIAPTSTPRESELSLDWQTCLAEMKVHVPEIAKSAKDAGPNSVNREIAVTFLPDLAQTGPLADSSPKDPKADSEPANEQEQFIHRQTHELARYFLEVSANFKQFQTATTHLSEALTRLEVFRSDYEQGEAAVGPYLDTVARWSKAVSNVADFKARYNTSTAAVARAKGTLLDRDGITLLAPRPSRDSQTIPASHEAP